MLIWKLSDLRHGIILSQFVKSVDYFLKCTESDFILSYRSKIYLDQVKEIMKRKILSEYPEVMNRLIMKLFFKKYRLNN